MTTYQTARIAEIRHSVANYRESIINDERVRPMAGWVDVIFLLDLLTTQGVILDELTRR